MISMKSSKRQVTLITFVDFLVKMFRKIDYPYRCFLKFLGRTVNGKQMMPVGWAFL